MRYRARVELLNERGEVVEAMPTEEMDADDRHGWRKAVWDLAFALMGWVRKRRET